MTRKNNVIYWITTGLLAFGMLAQDIAQTLHTKGYVDIINVHLGYPLYFLNIIGTWKLLGVIAILIPRFKLVKEWAYAGFFFNVRSIFYILRQAMPQKIYFLP